MTDAIPQFDMAQLGMLREALGDDNFHALLVGLPDAGSTIIKQIAAAIASGDLGSARRAAHDLKGMAGSFGAVRLADLARAIELEPLTLEEVSDRVTALADAVEMARAGLSEIWGTETRSLGVNTAVK